jgi:hypothetical protein
MNSLALNLQFRGSKNESLALNLQFWQLEYSQKSIYKFMAVGTNPLEFNLQFHGSNN